MSGTFFSSGNGEDERKKSSEDADGEREFEEGEATPVGAADN